MRPDNKLPARTKPAPRKKTKPGSAALPPTVSNKALMVDGSDSPVRRITHLHYILSGLLESIRGGFAGLIGVTSFQYVLMQALGRLHNSEGWTVGSIARQMHMTDAYVSTEIADLVQQGLVTKVINPNDRRTSFLTLTEKARERLSAISEVQQHVNDTLYGHLNRDSADAYASQLETLLAQARTASSMLEEISAEQRRAALVRLPRSRRR